MVSTTIIGIIAINVNKKANQLNAKLTELQIKDRKSFVTIDLNQKVRVYFNDNREEFVDILNKSYVHFYAYYFDEDDTVKDAIIIELSIMNISNNFMTGIYLEELEITSKDESYKALQCDSDNNVLVKPDETRNATVLIHCLPKLANKKAGDIFSYEANIKLKLVTINLVGEKTEEYIDILLDQTGRIDDYFADYNPRIDEFKVMIRTFCNQKVKQCYNHK